MKNTISVYHQPIFHRPKSYSKNTFIKIINVSKSETRGQEIEASSSYENGVPHWLT